MRWFSRRRPPGSISTKAWSSSTRASLYHGADALNIMARLAPKQGLGNRLNRLMFGNSTFSRLVYPLLRGGRNTLLKLLGRTKIRDIDKKAPRQQ